jgi:hypothetical protein
VQNLLLKTPYKFKKSYCGTPEPQTAQDAPWLHGHSLKDATQKSASLVAPGIAVEVQPTEPIFENVLIFEKKGAC